MSGYNLTPEHAIAISDVLTQHTGIHVTEMFSKKLISYVTTHYQELGYADVNEYAADIESNNVSMADLEDLVAAIAVDESYFFRHKHIFSFLKNKWLPNILLHKRRIGDKSLRIWSAGCANGQEPYSLSIFLRENIADYPDWNIFLMGTDISTQAIKKAEEGKYGSFSFRDNTPYIDKYFKPLGNGAFEVNDTIRNDVKLGYLNLVDDNYPSILTETNSMDLILCCNVFIYLEKSYIYYIMQHLAESLSSTGILMLAATDTVEDCPRSLKIVEEGSLRYYQLDRTPHVPILKTGKQTSSKKDVKHLTDDFYQPLSDLYTQLNHEKWLDALETVEACLRHQGSNAELLQHKARILANLGELSLALEICNQSLKLNELDAHTFLIKALIQLEMGNERESEHVLRKAIYLNVSFVEARYHLGLLLLRRGDRDQGFKVLEETLSLLNKMDPQRRVHHAPRLTFAHFSEIVKRELVIYRKQASQTDE